MFDDKGRIPKCPECGEKFDNVFEAVEHMLEDDDSFDPAFILPGGLKLLLGSLLWNLYQHRDEPDVISELVQDCYATLAMAEYVPEAIPTVINDMLIEQAMENFDDELNKLFKAGE